MHQYKQEGHPTNKLFLTDKEYARALLSLVKYCHDVLPIGPSGNFYLPRRRENGNLPGYWFVGGAVKPFTLLAESLVQTVKREMGIEFKIDRFIHIRQNRYWLNGKEKGGIPHDALCEVYALPLTEEEIQAVHLDPEEYETEFLQPFVLEDINNISDKFKRAIFLDLWGEKDSWL